MKREFDKAFKDVKELARGRAHSVSIRHVSWNEDIYYYVYIASPPPEEDAYVIVDSKKSFDEAVEMAKARLIELGLLT